jgi:hypothetical protein
MLTVDADAEYRLIEWRLVGVWGYFNPVRTGPWPRQKAGNRSYDRLCPDEGRRWNKDNNGSTSGLQSVR